MDYIASFYLNSVERGLREEGYYVERPIGKPDTLAIGKQDNEKGYIIFQLQDGGLFTMVREIYGAIPGTDIFSMEDTHVQVEMPYYENIIQMVELYFKYG